MMSHPFKLSHPGPSDLLSNVAWREHLPLGAQGGGVHVCVVPYMLLLAFLAGCVLFLFCLLF